MPNEGNPILDLLKEDINAYLNTDLTDQNKENYEEISKKEKHMTNSLLAGLSITDRSDIVSFDDPKENPMMLLNSSLLITLYSDGYYFEVVNENGSTTHLTTIDLEHDYYNGFKGEINYLDFQNRLGTRQLKKIPKKQSKSE